MPLAAISLPLSPSREQEYLSIQERKLIMTEKNLLFLRKTPTCGAINVNCPAIGSWLWELNSLVQRRQKNRADKNNKEIITLIEEIYNSTDLKRIRAIRKELFDIVQVRCG
jgi:hypothetical protein